MLKWWLLFTDLAKPVRKKLVLLGEELVCGGNCNVIHMCCQNSLQLASLRTFLVPHVFIQKGLTAATFFQSFKER